MEIDPNHSWGFMVAMALLLGLRHGFNLDHLAAIDAMTSTMRDRPILSKMVGFFFSLGHGVIVTIASIMIGGGLFQTHIPEWLEGFGNWVSVFFLFIFGGWNLWSVFQKAPSSAVPVGIKGFFAKKLFAKRRGPLLIISVGALFAFSFDTLSQIALFSISASLLAGWLFSGIIGLLFMIGMMFSDTLNSFLISSLIRRANRNSMALLRGLGIAISLFSLIVGIRILLKLL